MKILFISKHVFCVQFTVELHNKVQPWQVSHIEVHLETQKHGFRASPLYTIDLKNRSETET